MSSSAKMKTEFGVKNGKTEETKYLPELLAEKDSLDSSFTHATKLITAEIERIQKGEVGGNKEPEYLDLFASNNIKVKERVLIPNKRFPRYNFVGKILGPQGTTIKQLQEQTGARISVLGKGSMKDKSKEEELRKGGEAKFAHLSMELHVFIEVMAPIPECYLRMAHAMDEVKKFLTPDPAEYEQFADPGYPNGAQAGAGRGRGGPPGRGRGGPPHNPAGARGRGMLLRGGARGAPRGAAPRGVGQRGGAMRGGPRGGGAPGGPAGRGAPSTTPTRGGAAPRSRPPAAGAPRMLPPQALSHQEHKPHHPAKPEAYEEYGSYEESYPAEPAYESYDAYYTQQQQQQQQQPQPADTEYYDYGHGETQETYEPYAQDDWGEGSWSTTGGKAPPARQTKGAYREHPYGGRY